MKNKVTIAIPCYNEGDKLEKNVLKVLEFCKKSLKEKFLIVIADNKSTDNTKEIGRRLTKQHREIKYDRINIKGKGASCKHAWKKYKSEINIYMDADLATDITTIKKAVNEIKKGNDLVIGSRYLKESKTKRTPTRIIISKVYILLTQHLLKTKISDFQCGFKAVNKKVVEKLLPKIRDNKFFFDTELIIKAKNEGYKIKEIPVKWEESKDTKVRLIEDSLDALKKLIKLKKELKI